VKNGFKLGANLISLDEVWVKRGKTPSEDLFCYPKFGWRVLKADGTFAGKIEEYKNVKEEIKEEIKDEDEIEMEIELEIEPKDEPNVDLDVKPVQSLKDFPLQISKKPVFVPNPRLQNSNLPKENGSISKTTDKLKNSKKQIEAIKSLLKSQFGVDIEKMDESEKKMLQYLFCMNDATLLQIENYFKNN
jgi:hypothetical protein